MYERSRRPLDFLSNAVNLVCIPGCDFHQLRNNDPMLVIQVSVLIMAEALSDSPISFLDLVVFAAAIFLIQVCV